MLAVDQGYVAMAAADLLTKAFKCLSSMISNLIRPLRKSGMTARNSKNLHDPIQSNKKESDNGNGRRGLIESPRASRLLKNGLCV
jgi:hypothetical protein